MQNQSNCEITFYTQLKTALFQPEQCPFQVSLLINTLFCSYGDMTPFSLVGRLTGIVCSLSGIMVVALPAPVLEKNFNRKKEEGRPDHNHNKKHGHSKPSSSVSTSK